jgi:hypothetical protein
MNPGDHRESPTTTMKQMSNTLAEVKMFTVS